MLKKCSSISCYGDSGHYPLGEKLSKQVVCYYNRLDNLNAANDPSLARHASLLIQVKNTKTLLELAGQEDENLANIAAIRSTHQDY